MHPYEIEKPEIELDMSNLPPSEKKKMVKIHTFQLRNRDTMKKKIQYLLKDFEFSPIMDILRSSRNVLEEIKIENLLIE